MSPHEKVTPCTNQHATAKSAFLSTNSGLAFAHLPFFIMGLVSTFRLQFRRQHQAPVWSVQRF